MLDVLVEPISIITALGVAFVRGAGGRVGSSLAAELGLSSTDSLAARLTGIESHLAALQVQPHRENLRRGIVLLREAAYQSDSGERSRRLRVAEDNLIVSATDSQLDYDDRAGAALLAAVSSAERGSQHDAVRWLWASNSLLCAFVGDRIHHQKAILADSAPAYVRAEVDRQARAANPVVKFFSGHQPELAPLRHRLRAEAHAVLEVWTALREVLSNAEPGYLAPPPSITAETGAYTPGIQAEAAFVDLDVAIAAKPHIPIVGGGTALTVTHLERLDDRLRLLGRVRVHPNATIYSRPTSGIGLAAVRATAAVRPSGAHIGTGMGGLLGYDWTRHGEPIGTLHLSSIFDGATFGGEFQFDEPFAELRVRTSECVYRYTV